jgi:hypothetical protein
VTGHATRGNRPIRPHRPGGSDATLWMELFGRHAMNEQRLETLRHKGSRPGLSDAEAEELGRLYAERAGRPYSSHADEPRSTRVARRSMEPTRTRRLFDRIRFWRGRSLEIGLTAPPPEDVIRAASEEHQGRPAA